MLNELKIKIVGRHKWKTRTFRQSPLHSNNFELAFV